MTSDDEDDVPEPNSDISSDFATGSPNTRPLFQRNYEGLADPPSALDLDLADLSQKTQKRHQDLIKVARFWYHAYWVLVIGAAVTAAAAGATAIGEAAGPVFVGVLSLLAAALSSTLAVANPVECKARAGESANAYSRLQDEIVAYRREPTKSLDDVTSLEADYRRLRDAELKELLPPRGSAWHTEAENEVTPKRSNEAE